MGFGTRITQIERIITDYTSQGLKQLPPEGRLGMSQM